jgi:BASS family bile acid:Na+ symporter
MTNSPTGRLADFLHHHFLGLVVTAYILAAAWPAAGLALKGCHLLAHGCALPLPGLLLALLLVNAGLAVGARDVLAVTRRPRLLVAGLLANLMLPLGFVVAAAVAVRAWHDPVEADCLLFGLAVIAAMPVAGSSAAWSQNADGNLALSLGLVVGSTLLSPLTTPLSFAAVAHVAGAGGAVSVMARHPAGDFLAAFVVLPTAAGMAFRQLVGVEWVERHKPALKSCGSVTVLVLCYVNASASLPQVARDPDWDFLALVVGAAVALCAAAFAAGRLVAGWLGAGRAEASSLMYGLGMSNNGTGLVLAASVGVPPEAVLPVLVYNLVQHLVAGAVNRVATRSDRTVPSPTPGPVGSG